MLVRENNRTDEITHRFARSIVIKNARNVSRALIRTYSFTAIQLAQEIFTHFLRRERVRQLMQAIMRLRQVTFITRTEAEVTRTRT